MAMITTRVIDTTHVAKAGMTKAKKDRTGGYQVAAGLAISLTLIWPIAGCDGNILRMPHPSVRYLAFGDSSTLGASEHSYPEALPELLGQPPETIANEGSSGETAAAGLARLRQLLSLGLYPNADTLLYWEGGADVIGFAREVDRLLLFSPLAPNYPYSTRLLETLDRVQADIEAAIRTGQQAGLTVYVATYFSFPEDVTQCDPLPLDIILPSQARNASGYVSLLNDRIRQAATQTGATLVDIALADEVLQAEDSHFLNCNHLSDKGNEIVAQLFAEALAR